MARIAGVNIPDDKQARIALTHIHGIGRSTAEKLVDELDIDAHMEVNDLTEQELTQLRQSIEQEYKVEGELKQEVSRNIQRLKDIDSYRGERHEKDLPVRGQRTKTNARTKRGRRKTVGGTSSRDTLEKK